MYGAGIAEIYDLLHEARGKDFGAEAATVTGLIRAREPGAASLLDVACGTGAHLRHFGEHFAHTEGLELSEAMLAVARVNTPGAVLRQGDMRALATGRVYDAITCMFGSIGYMTDTSELRSALRSFARHLSPGGVVVVEPWWFPETFIDGHVSGDVVTVRGRTVARVSHSAREGAASHMRVHYVVAEAGAGARHFVEEHRISLFTRAEYEEAFARAGLEVGYHSGVPSGRGLFVGTLPARD
ncbi:class I SAM-dependent methyltransferase [Streptomyces sp. NPDC001678]|uniref:class I SAM-dependent methyltransferase n=1 Tax=Streptomyces sp. NPDC001678 TaxID=3364599 RepID=UPI003673CADF